MFLDLDQFVDKYQRNNKQTGVKNLRCFPACAPEGHQSNGFCGRAVRISLEPGTHFAISEFTQITSRQVFTVGQPMPVASIQNYSGFVLAKRLGADAADNESEWSVESIPLVIDALRRTTPSATATPVIAELRVRRGWHYDWVSNRHTCMNLHCLRVYMFRIINEGRDIVCMKIIDSPPFQVYSRRRSLKERVGPRGMILHRTATSAGSLGSADSQGNKDGDDGSDEPSQEEDDDASLEEKQEDLPGKRSFGTLRLAQPSSSSLPLNPGTLFTARPTDSALPVTTHMAEASNSNQYGGNLNFFNLSVLFEFLEVSETGTFCIELNVSPFVFARAIEGLTFERCDGRTFDILIQLKRLKPSSGPKASLCQGLAGHVKSSPRLTSGLTSVSMASRTHFEVINNFLTFTSHAFVEYASLITTDIDMILQHFRPSSPVSGIFRPLFPYGHS